MLYETLSKVHYHNESNGISGCVTLPDIFTECLYMVYQYNIVYRKITFNSFSF